jgi:CheY-like chemotaxis protein
LRVVVAAEAAAAADASLTNCSSSGRRRFLLVVDSDVEKLFHTATLLQRFQYNIWTAKSAAEALEMAAVAVPALIITAQFLDDYEHFKSACRRAQKASKVTEKK